LSRFLFLLFLFCSLKTYDNNNIITKNKCVFSILVKLDKEVELSYNFLGREFNAAGAEYND